MPALTDPCTPDVTTQHPLVCYHDKTILVVAMMNAAHHWVPLSHQVSPGCTSPALLAGTKRGKLVMRLIQQEALWCLQFGAKALET